MRFLYVIDALDTLNLETETSLLLIEEAAGRGHANRVAFVGDLYLNGAEAWVQSHAIDLDLTRRPFYRLSDVRDERCDAFDLILMRKDPPVDEAYLTATFILEHAAATTPVVNDPVALRTVNEKLLPLAFPQFAAPTLVTSDRARITAFLAAHGRSVLKPLNDCSGRGIRILPAGAAAPADLGVDFVIVQQFIDAVADGDKRIFLLDGGAIGAVNRIPRGPDALANIHQGARVAATTLTAREHAIVDQVGSALAKRGLWMAGLDVIGGYLTEVNVTSPSAARQINAVSGTHIERELVDFMEAKARGAC